VSLNATNLAKTYGGKTIFSGFTGAFGPGLHLITGPSGAGKSTLLRLIATVEAPSGGVLSWNGIALPRGRAALREQLGYAPQAADLPDDLTAIELARYIAALKKLKVDEAAAQFCAVADAIGLGGDVSGRIATYSGGMRRRLITALALLGAPKLLALDEPLSELDADSAAAVTGLILAPAQTATVVMTTHAAQALALHAAMVLRVANGAVTPA
jgi:ABC-type multidrug transport system ATPase subunit